MCSWLKKDSFLYFKRNVFEKILHFRRMKLKKEIQAIKELNEQEKAAQAAKAAAAAAQQCEQAGEPA